MKFTFKHLSFIAVILATGQLTAQTDAPVSPVDPAIADGSKHKDDLNSLKDQLVELKKKIESYKKGPQDPHIDDPELNLDLYKSELSKENLTPDVIKKNKEKINDYLNELDNKIARIEALAQTEAARLGVIPTGITNAEKQLGDDGTSVTKPTTANEQEIAEAKIELASTQIDKLNAEQDFFIAKSKLNKSYLNTLEKRRKLAIPIAEKWDTKFSSLESENFKRITTELDLIKNPADLPTELGSTLQNTKSLLTSHFNGKSATSELKRLKSDLADLKNVKTTLDDQERFATDRIKLIEDAGLSIDIKTGHLLRTQRTNLPSARSITATLKKSTMESTDNELAIIDLNSTLAALPNENDDHISFYNLESTSTLFSEADLKALTVNLKSVNNSLLSTRNDLKKTYQEYQVLLKSTATAAEKYSKTLDEKLLWIASHQTINTADIKSEVIALEHLALTTISKKWLPNSYRNILDYPIQWGLATLLIVTSLLLSFRFKARAAEQHKKASSRTISSVVPTLLGVSYEFIRALPYPLLIFVLSRLTSEPLEIRLALQSAAATLFLGLVMRNLSVKGGFLDSNFEIILPQLRILKTIGSILAYVATPLIFINEALNPSFSQIKEGRIILVLLLMLMSAVLFYALRPRHGLLRGAEKKFLKTALFVVAFSFPLILAIASLIGYHHSAIALLDQYKFSIRALIIIIFTLYVCKLLLLISKRRLAKSTIMHEDVDEFTDTALTKQERIKLKLENISEINIQTEKLINIGGFMALVISFWVIWASTLPALKVLDKVRVWGDAPIENVSATVSNDSSADEASAPSSSSLLGMPSSSSQGVTASTSGKSPFVSIQDILTALVVGISTYLLAINLPGLIEILILNKIRLKSGSAYAIKTALRYLIVIIGMSWCFSAIDVTWGKVQWLAAAVSLGIGFGLQEIFANFVAGIILLFERPIRIGDLVTVGGINGRVSKIQIRATTILQFNNRELIVPNKEFITGQLQNWTLSDSMVRAEILVGIAYGSDTQLAKDLLFKIASEHPLTLADPEPKVLFTAFGASSLDFILRFHIPTADDLVPVQSEVHFAIDDAFREANIEMAFPQQDIHIRSIEAPLKIVSQQEPSEA